MIYPLIIQFLLVLGIPIFALASKPSYLRQVLYTTAISIFVYILITPHPDVQSDLSQAIGMMGSSFLATAFNFLFLMPNVQDTLKPNNQLKPASQLSFMQRLKWATELTFNLRGANWNCDIPGLRYPKTSSRWEFVYSQLLWAGFYYFVGDVIGAITRRIPAFQYPPTESISTCGLGWKAVYVTLFWTSMCLLMNRIHTTLSVILVAVGVSDPEDWPALFGLWPNTKSMRTFWGRSWHQCMRRSIQPHSKFLTSKILCLPPKSLLSKYIELGSCFFLSGVFHVIAEWLVSRNLSTALAHLNLFFYLTGAIILEDFVIFLGKKIGINKVPTIVSYLWVLWWMTVCSRRGIETVVKVNNYRVAPEVSVIEMLLERVSFLAVLVITILALAIKPSPIQPVLYSVAFSIYIYILVTPNPDVKPDILHGIGVMGTSLLAAAFNFLFLEPNAQDTLRENNQLKPASQLSLLQRLKWATKLLLNLRGANWNCAVPGLRYPGASSRWNFVFSQLLWTGFYYLLGDLIGSFTRRIPAFQYPPTESLNARGLGWQAVYVTVFWTSMCIMMNRVHSTVSAVLVAVGESSPQDWPAFFGVWLDTTSMRKFWGRSWHQIMRRSIQPHSKFLTNNILRLPPKSLLATYIELLCCFFLSGVYHSAADWLVLRNPSTALINFKFFFGLSGIIILEDFIIFLGKNIGINKVPTIVSYMWVLWWMTVSSPMAIETMIMGNNYHVAPEISVVDMLLQKIPITV
ncbi:membrane bound O-acyl transferase family-domain-containing protein [Cyathus striatus]|nr:membrane bound O-acyl transferase family-domain-containing protein [Cyathus striatus]